MYRCDLERTAFQYGARGNIVPLVEVAHNMREVRAKIKKHLVANITQSILVKQSSGGSIPLNDMRRVLFQFQDEIPWVVFDVDRFHDLMLPTQDLTKNGNGEEGNPASFVSLSDICTFIRHLQDDT